MEYIQNTLNGVGRVNFVISQRNTSNGSSGQYTQSYWASNIVASSNQCLISYRWRAWQNGTPRKDNQPRIDLRSVASVTVEPDQQHTTEINANNGHPNLIALSTSPAMTDVLVNNGSYVFPLSNANLANRVAAALNRAAKLCGGEAN